MLKARNPGQFAEFITMLCSKLKEIVVGNFGVFDKFTGDGVLAFFPHFYSGPSAGLFAVKTAEECHSAFVQHYRENRRCFNSVIAESGLGIGIDYGKVQIVQVADDLTIVGNPVVYACRMGSAPAGTTLVNQPAYELLMDGFSANCDFREKNIEFKHEGKMIAYRVRLSKRPLELVNPEWLQMEDDVLAESTVTGSSAPFPEPECQIGQPLHSADT